VGELTRDRGSILAIRRGETVIRRITPELRIERGDLVWMCAATRG
jgi:uncharacterized protein with PhoU and TrkA domain